MTRTTYLIRIAMCAWTCAFSSAAQKELWEARTKLGQFKTALAAAQELERDGQEDAANTQRSVASEHLRRARDLFDLANASESKDADVLMEYAETLALTEDPDLAAEVLQRCVQIRPESAPAWLALGRALAELGPGRLADAERALREAVRLAGDAPQNTEARTMLVMCYWNAGLYDFARESSQELAEHAPNHIPNRIIMAALDIRDGKLLDASDALDELGALPPGLSVLLANMLTKALDDFDLSRRSIPDEPEHHAAYAKLLMRADRLEASRLPLERALRLDPNNYTYWNLLASLSRLADDLPRARDAYRRSLEIYPDQPRTREALQSLEDEAEPEPATSGPVRETIP